MVALHRWIAPLLIAAGLGAASIPTAARADDQLVRVIVDIADVVLRGETPYYRHGGYGHNDRLVVSYDRYGRPVYHRTVQRHSRHHRGGPPRHAPAHGYRVSQRGHHGGARGNNSRCDRNGRCTVRYYDPRYDRDNRRSNRRHHR